MPRPPAPSSGLALSPTQGPIAAHAPFLNPAPLFGARRPPTPHPWLPGWPPHFGLGPQAPRHLNSATRLAGPTTLKLQLPAGSARSSLFSGRGGASVGLVTGSRVHSARAPALRGLLALRLQRPGCPVSRAGSTSSPATADVAVAPALCPRGAQLTPRSSQMGRGFSRKDNMSKRKKARTSGGEGIRLPKPPKNLRLGDCDGAPQSSQSGCLHHPDESEGSSGPASSAERSREEPGQAASSSPEEEAGPPSRLLRQPEEEPGRLPPSQTSLGRFVPQFAKPRKTVTRQAARRAEDLGSGACGSEAPPEPSAQQAESQPWEESLGHALREARGPGDQTQADGAPPGHSSQNPVMPVPSSGHPQPSASTDAAPEWGTVPVASERASQGHLSEQGTSTPDGGSTEGAWFPGDCGQEGHLPSSDAEEKEPDPGAPREGGAQRGAGADLPEGQQEGGDGILGPATWGLPDPVRAPSGTGGGAEQSCSSPRPSCLATVVITAVSTDPAEPEQRAPEVAGPDGEAAVGPPASASGKAPEGCHSGALLGSVSLTRETTGGRGEAGQEDRPPGDIPEGPAAALALAHGVREATVSAGEASSLASEVGLGVDQTRGPGADQEGPGGVCARPLLSQPTGEEAAESGSQSREQDLGALRLPLGASTPPAHRGAVDGPTWEAGAGQGCPDVPSGSAGQPEQPPSSAERAVWGGSPAMDLDFLPDSQIQAALEGPDFEAPPEQVFPAGSGAGLCWPGTGTCADGGPLAEAQPRTLAGIKACEAARMEDATDTVRGLILELSNLNRLIMSTHRGLEAFKRLTSRRAKPAGRGPAPCTSKGAASLPRGEHPWRDL
ncbi:hypothetical protein HPG69_018168 [Diceros bicornis minor]|uniref:Uncharacterized protein n=1 Tax=Diceros bicornis minor TaxID=77932 RepID=A0A7J7FLS2_DICBM|nr:hypothetical protein HPG69_018168 [Diceros bicornis minor]